MSTKMKEVIVFGENAKQEEYSQYWIIRCTVEHGEEFIGEESYNTKQESLKRAHKLRNHKREQKRFFNKMILP